MSVCLCICVCVTAPDAREEPGIFAVFGPAATGGLCFRLDLFFESCHSLVVVEGKGGLHAFPWEVPFCVTPFPVAGFSSKKLSN